MLQVRPLCSRYGSVFSSSASVSSPQLSSVSGLQSPGAALYRFAAIWLGFLNYLFLAACLSWLVWYALLLTRLSANPNAERRP